MASCQIAPAGVGTYNHFTLVGFSVRFRVGRRRGVSWPLYIGKIPYPAMRKNLRLALMASTVIATSLSLTTPRVQAEAGSGESIVATTDDSGHKVYVNDSVPVSNGRSRTSEASPVR